MKTALQVRDALAELRLISLTLPDLISLPDPESAVALNGRMALLDMVEAAAKVSYSHRLVIIREFEVRRLWQYLIDPMVGEPFPNLTAWLASGFLGCRRVNMEAHRDAQMLPEMKPQQLLDVPKSSIKVLTGVSTDVRNRPDVLEEAKKGDDALLEKLETEHPGQHIEQRKPMHLMLGRSERKAVDAWTSYAIEHDIAGTVKEAIVRACEMALDDAKLDEELKAMPAEEEKAPA